MASTFDDGPIEPPFSATPRRRGPALAILLVLLAGIAGGLIVAGYAARHWDVARRLLVPAGAAPAQVVAVPRPVLIGPAPGTSAPALARQVDEIGERLEAVDARARAAVGNADRAEGLLVAFAARRAVERGVELGYIEGLLREHFGAAEPQAVATVISAARRPVTMAALRDGLAAAEGALVQGDTAESGWSSFRRELSNLLVLRRTDARSTAPVDRYARATAALGAGEVGVALAEVSRMPGRTGAAAWIAQARRYLAARTALDRLETAALVAPAAAPAPLS